MAMRQWTAISITVSSDFLSNEFRILILSCPTVHRIKDCELTLLLRQTTGHMEQPRVQQQQRQPNSSQRTLTGRALRSVTFTRVTVACSVGHVSLSTRAITWHTHLELLGRHAGVEGCWELGVESVGKTKSGKKRRSIVSSSVQFHIAISDIWSWV